MVRVASDTVGILGEDNIHFTIGYQIAYPVQTRTL
jgi:hypothetical protein